MKFFLDTANLEEIKEASKTGLIDGVTTNPSLMAKEGAKDFDAHMLKICKLVDTVLQSPMEVLNLGEATPGPDEQLNKSSREEDEFIKGRLHEFGR